MRINIFGTNTRSHTSCLAWVRISLLMFCSRWTIFDEISYIRRIGFKGLLLVIFFIHTQCTHAQPSPVFWVRLLLLLFSWPLVCQVFPNHEVAMFQPWTGNPPYRGSVANFYLAILIIPAPKSFARHLMYARGGGLSNHPPPLFPLLKVVYPHRIISPPGRHLYPSQNTEAHCSLNQTPLPP